MELGEGTWALIEQMGHKSIAGYVREVQIAGVPVLRVDVPGQTPESTPVASQYIHASSLYALTPMAESMVRKIAARTRVEPPATWGIDEQRQLPAPEPEFDFGDGPEDTTTVIDRLLEEHTLAGVLELLEQQHIDVGQPTSDRYAAILKHAKDLVVSNRWPEEPPAAAGAGA